MIGAVKETGGGSWLSGGSFIAVCFNARQLDRCRLMRGGGFCIDSKPGAWTSIPLHDFVLRQDVPACTNT